MNTQVAKKYKLVGIELGTHQFTGFGTINLEEITLVEADALYAAGFQFLVKKTKADKEDAAEAE